MLTACTGSVASIRMSVFGCEDKERECPIKVLLAPRCTNPIGITVGQKVLSIWETPIRQSLK